MLPGEKLTLLALSELENADYGYAYPSLEFLSGRTMQNERTLRRHIRTLVDVAALKVLKQRHNDGKWLSSVYFLNVPLSYRRIDKEWMAKQGADTVSFRDVA